MTRPTPTDPVRRLLARIAGRGRVDGAGGPEQASDLELLSPEQRLLGVVARHGWLAPAEDAGTRPSSNASAAGVRTVAPTDPSGAPAPAWLRRLNEPGAADGEQPTVATGPPRPPVGPRRPRRP